MSYDLLTIGRLTIYLSIFNFLISLCSNDYFNFQLSMLPLILFILLAILVLVATELNERRKKSNSPKDGLSAKRSDSVAVQQRSGPVEGCCGTHLVCEKETLLQTNARIEYYDDEELDELAGIAPEDYTEEQVNAIREVFGSLQESDVPGWCRSMQLRNINLPQDIREEALLIVRELRQKQ